MTGISLSSGWVATPSGEKSHELRTGVARGGFAQDLSAGNLQGGVERERARAEILKAVALGTPGRKGQNWSEPIESLKGALFIHTEHSCMGWGLEGESDDVRRLGLEIGIIAGHGMAATKGLQPRLAPDTGHSHVAHAQRSGQVEWTPMGGVL